MSETLDNILLCHFLLFIKLLLKLSINLSYAFILHMYKFDKTLNNFVTVLLQIQIYNIFEN